MTATNERPPGGEPEAFHNDTGGASGKDYQETPTVSRFLEVVYGRGNGWVHLSTTNRQITSYPAANCGPMADIIAGKHDVYLSAAVAGNNAGSGEGGRVENSDMVELTALWVDIDRVGPGHKTTGPLWTRDDMGQLLERLPVGPSAVVDSGGGWWLWFVLAEPVPLNGDGSGELLLARWRRYWIDFAADMGRHIDTGVWNPGRIARAPGSINTKEGGRRPAVLKSLYPNRVYTFDELDTFLPAPEPPRTDRKQHTGDGDRPGDEYNRNATVSSVVALLEAHGFHSPRQVGGRVDLTRPGKNARDGHSVTVWPDAVTTFWSSAPEGQPGTITLRDGASGTYDPFGLHAHLEHGGDFQAAARALNPAPAGMVVAAPPPGGTFADLLDLDIEPIRFVVDGLIPEGLTILAGKPKLGKSWLALLLALAVCAGRDALGRRTVAGEGLYIALEDGDRRLQDRVRVLGGAHMGAALRRLHYRTDWPALSRGGVTALEQWMSDHPDTRLIVIDTYARVRGDLPGKDRYAEEYNLLAPLQKFATDHRVAVVLVHHLRKQAADDWLEQLSGSQAVTGTADTLLGLFRERGQMDATLRLVSREVDELDLALRFNAGSWESMGDAAAYRITVERSAVLRALEDLGGEGKVADIAALVEKTAANTSKLIIGLAKEGLVVKRGHGLYSLPGPVEVVETVEIKSTTPPPKSTAPPGISTKSTTTVDQSPLRVAAETLTAAGLDFDEVTE